MGNYVLSPELSGERSVARTVKGTRKLAAAKNNPSSGIEDIWRLPPGTDWDFDRAETYDYALPPQLIATNPEAARDESRLLVAVADQEELEHRQFTDLPNFLSPMDLLVFNNTQVIPARLNVFKETGGKVELFVLGGAVWEEVCQGVLQLECMTRSSKPLRVGMWLADPARPEMPRLHVSKVGGGKAQLEVAWSSRGIEFLERFGEVPLPPYIVQRRLGAGESATHAEDRRRYQTVYASVAGAVAAPTAGLHFSSALLEELDQMGVERREITLSVGPGTFQPLRSNRLSEHKMHSEDYFIPAGLNEAIEACRARGGRVIAVGTTSARALEAEARRERPFEEGWRSTDIFLRPGQDFEVCDGLITNFHLPMSTLLALVAAFLGYEQLREVYNTAIAQGYRFYSYGDASLLVRRSNKHL